METNASLSLNDKLTLRVMMRDLKDRLERIDRDLINTFLRRTEFREAVKRKGCIGVHGIDQSKHFKYLVNNYHYLKFTDIEVIKKLKK